MQYKGSCHCGRIAYDVALDLKEVMECNCSICSRKGYLLAFVPRTALTLHTPEEDLSTYRFNRNVIAHHFCSVCGCSPFGIGEHNGMKMAAINVRCLEGVDLQSLAVRQIDGRSL